jgi:CheY-like chemotaxis protein
MLGHELRNPLAPIRNVVHVLKRGQSTDQRLQRSYDMIERQVSHMARLIDDLLDVSRISHGKIQLKKCKVDVADILKTCAEDFHPLMERSSLLFHQQIPDEPVWVYGDTARLEQIVSNLLINAMKFTDPGGSVTLGLVVLGNQAEITVQDTGVGMGPEVLRRVFDPFCQANKSVDRSRGGLGLGLALVKGLVELHGGQVKAESPGVGLGALLRVRLPLQMPVAAVQCEKSAPLEKETKALRVLIIEDNIDAADSLQLLLSTFGHDVSLANSGSEGVEKASEFKPDVVLCDIGLPGSMDGYAVARALRNDPQFSGLQMIAMTGYGQDEDRRRAKEAGFDRHLTKPVNPETLEHLLAQ